MGIKEIRASSSPLFKTQNIFYGYELI